MIIDRQGGGESIMNQDERLNYLVENFKEENAQSRY